MRKRATHIGWTIAIAVFVCVASGSARADVIDGEWCLGTSHFTIDGPNIRTPGGYRIQGNYSRHSFVYTVPANEPDAGSEISMLLLNEETVQLTRTARSSKPEIWQRCRPTS